MSSDMIPSVVAVLVYQALAILGASGLGNVVTYIAYRSEDLDTKLMYEQSTTDLILNFRKFKQSPSKKIMVVCFTILALVIDFIPTIMSKVTSGNNLYYDQKEVPLSTLDSYIVSNNNYWPSTLPYIDDFLPYLQYSNSTSIDDMYRHYLYSNLYQQIAPNPDGIWLSSNHSLTYNYNNQQNANSDNFYVDTGNGTSVRTYSALGHRVADSSEPTSSTIENCMPSDGASNIVVFPNDSNNLTVKAAYTYATSCYPMYDSSTAVYIVNSIPNIPSVLSRSDTIYRLPQLTSGVTGVCSFGVSLFNHNTTHMTMGVMKMASITMYNYNQSMTLPATCGSSTIATAKNVASVNFQDQPYDAVFCDLFGLSNSSFAVLQATGRFFQNNYEVNVVYTVQNGGEYEQGQSAMMDLTMFAAYTVEGQLANNNEELVAYQTNSIGTTIQADNSFDATLANDNIGLILNELDKSVINETTINMLVAMASARVRWSFDDLSDFTKVSANTVDAVETPHWWIVVVVVLAGVFILPQSITLMYPSARQYSGDLRSMLINTLIGDDIGDDDQKKIEGFFSFAGNKAAKPRHFNLAMQKKGDNRVKLTVDGSNIAPSTKVEQGEKSSNFVKEQVKSIIISNIIEPSA